MCAQENHNIGKFTKYIRSIPYLVHAAVTGTRDQTCHSVKQLLKVLLVPEPSLPEADSCIVNTSKKPIRPRKTLQSSVPSRTFCRDYSHSCYPAGQPHGLLEPWALRASGKALRTAHKRAAHTLAPWRSQGGESPSQEIAGETKGCF